MHFEKKAEDFSNSVTTLQTTFSIRFIGRGFHG